MRARLLLVASAVAAATAMAPPALANGRFPAANHLVAQPGDANRILLRATFGFVYTADRGKTWSWVCERAVGYSGVVDPPVGLLAGGRTVAALFNGLAVSDPAACGWTFAGGDLDRQVFVDVAVRPDAPTRAVAVSGTNVGTDDGGSRYRTQVFTTEDDGATWAPLGAALDPTVIVETIEVAASDPGRLYATAVRGEDAAREGLFYASKDRGAHWTVTKVPLDLASERAPYIAAVDPNKADRVYVRTEGPAKSRLLVSDDGGATFRAVWAGGRMQGFALSPDGGKVYLGGQLEGLHVASAADLTFTKRSTVQIECLMTSGATLFACSNEASGFIVGASEDEGGKFTPLLRLHTVRGPLPCAPGTAAAACVAEWPTLRDNLGVVEDAGSPPVDAGRPAPAPTPAPPASGASKCGCRAVGARGDGPAALALLALAAAAFALRPRTRPSRAAR